MLLPIMSLLVAWIVSFITTTTTSVTVYAQQTTTQPITTAVTKATTTNVTTSSTNATNSTAMPAVVITNLTYYGGAGRENSTEPLSQEAIQFQHADSTFAKLVQFTKDCDDLTNGIMSQAVVRISVPQPDLSKKSTCDHMLTHGVEHFCTFGSSYVAWCNTAKEVTDSYFIESMAVDMIARLAL